MPGDRLGRAKAAWAPAAGRAPCGKWGSPVSLPRQPALEDGCWNLRNEDPTGLPFGDGDKSQTEHLSQTCRGEAASSTHPRSTGPGVDPGMWCAAVGLPGWGSGARSSMTDVAGICREIKKAVPGVIGRH
ncbi:hypothetical protein VTJ04DRAFT_6103 [Mycothermus thermophilus]|uniref:uncharacterized protein n=1 Tax=Humicola insolens TaxID=85995 RepID=UPI0037430B2B